MLISMKCGDGGEGQRHGGSSVTAAALVPPQASPPHLQLTHNLMYILTLS